MHRMVFFCLVTPYQECAGTVAIQVCVSSIREEPFYFACQHCKKKNTEVCNFVLFSVVILCLKPIAGRYELWSLWQEPIELAIAAKYDCQRHCGAASSRGSIRGKFPLNEFLSCLLYLIFLQEQARLVIGKLPQGADVFEAVEKRCPELIGSSFVFLCRNKLASQDQVRVPSFLLSCFG